MSSHYLIEYVYAQIYILIILGFTMLFVTLLMSNILAWLKQPQIILLAVNNAKLNEIVSTDQNCLHHIKKH
jgi:hypothetical protein